jgi:outer membrane protein assembly factor BamB
MLVPVAAAWLALGCALWASADEVRLKNGQSFTGQVIETEEAVILRAGDGKSRQFSRASIDKIVYDVDAIRFPEVVPFVHRSLEDRDVAVRTGGGRGVVVPVRAEYPLVLFDPTGERAAVEINAPRRIRAPLIAGNWLYVVEHETKPDPKEKIVIGALEQPRPVHALTIRAVDLVQMKEVWTRVLDNNDRKPLLWAFDVSQVQLLPQDEKRLLLLTPKTGSPLDKRRVDPAVVKRFVTVSTLERDGAAVKVGSFDTEDLLGAVNFALAGELLAWQHPVELGAATFYDLRRRAKKGEAAAGKNERLIGLDAPSDLAFFEGPGYVTAYDLRKLGPVKGYPVSTSKLVAVNSEFVILRRVEAGTPAMVFLEPKGGRELFRVPYGAEAGLEYVGRHGKYVVFVDAQAGLLVFDTIKKAAAWRTAEFERGRPLSLASIGNTLYGLQLERLVAMDLHTGRRYWTAPISGVTRLESAGGGLVAGSLQTVRLVRQTRLPAGSTILSADGIPPVLTLDAGALSPPLLLGEAFVCADARGFLRAYDPKAQRWDAGVEAAARPLAGVRPAGVGSIVAIPGAGGMAIFDRAQGKRVADYPLNHLYRGDTFGQTGDVITFKSEETLVAYDLKQNKELWKKKHQGPQADPLRVGDRLFVLTESELLGLNPADGAVVRNYPLERAHAYRSVHADPAGRIVLRLDGLALAQRHERLQRDAWTYRPAVADPAVAASAPGAVALTADRYFFAHAGGELAALSAADGKELWKTPTPKLTSVLLAHADKLYFADRAVGLRVVGAADGKDAAEPVRVSDPAKFLPILMGEAVVFWSSDGYWVPAP